MFVTHVAFENFLKILVIEAQNGNSFLEESLIVHIAPIFRILAIVLCTYVTGGCD